jgi:DNA repair protein RadC
MDYLKELKIQYIKSKRKNPLQRQIKEPKNLVKIFKDLEKEDKEKVISVHFNARMKMNCFEVLSVGGTDMAFILPREVFKGLVLTNSVGFILLHNHPSGDPTPSDNDLKMIKELRHTAEKHLDLNFIDFIIVAGLTHVKNSA